MNVILTRSSDPHRYFEYADDELHYLSEFKSSDPRTFGSCNSPSPRLTRIATAERGFCLGPRHSLEVSQHEIARGYKLTVGVVEPLAFVVPRKVGRILRTKDASLIPFLVNRRKVSRQSGFFER